MPSDNAAQSSEDVHSVVGVVSLGVVSLGSASASPEVVSLGVVTSPSLPEPLDEPDSHPVMSRQLLRNRIPIVPARILDSPLTQ